MWVFARVSVIAFSGVFWWVLGFARLVDCLWQFVGGAGWLVECSESILYGLCIMCLACEWNLLNECFVWLY